MECSRCPERYYRNLRIELKLLHGKKDENGDSVFGKIIYDFIMKEQKNEL